MPFRLLSFLCLLIVSTTVAVPGRAAEKESNVLFIAVDDMNDWISRLNGHPQGNTPNIDKLTEMGVLFTKCYCAAPACNPSRAALMCGRRPSTTGIYFNGTPWKPALESMTTLPQHFQKNGYYALGSGKIYHGGHPPSWNEYAPSKEQHTFGADFKWPHNVNGLDKSHFDWGPIPQQANEMPDSKTVDWVIDQLNKEWDQPFFLACGFTRPHLPWYVPQEYFDQFPLDEIMLPVVKEDDLQDIPAAGRKMARPEGDHADVVKAGEWKKAVQGYLASLAFTDAMIGRLLQAYQNSPNRDNTIIVFWTDHGWHLGEKEHWRKFALWEDTTHVPLAIVVPGTKNAGEVCEVPCNLLDIYPTLIDLCGLKPNRDLEGQSLAKFLANPDAKEERFSLCTHGENNHSVRSNHYRYIRYADGSQELYDHRTDPNEWNNLAEDPAMLNVIKEHRAALPQINVPEIGTGNGAGEKGQKKKQGARKDAE